MQKLYGETPKHTPMIAAKTNRGFSVWTILTLLFAISILAYTIIRANVLSFTIDESISYLEYAHDSIGSIFFSGLSANNHPLNTLLMSYGEHCFGLAELSLRISAIIGHTLFLIFSFLLLKKFTSFPKYAILIVYIVVNTNPYILDFLSLARGYGISWGAVTASLYFQLIFLKFCKIKHLIAAMALSIIGILSNYTIILFFISSISLLMFFHFTWKIKGTTIRSFIPVVIVIACSILAVYFLTSGPIANLSQRNEFYFGGDQNLWVDVIV
ncbi:MAG: hypothetical protein KKD31_05700, partial [Bacteroidetes bacterium]|nr:hypothetical protein [Bacteroidota bacterium]